MKKILLLIALSFSIISVKSQNTNIVVSIARNEFKCGFNDLGYSIFYGTKSVYELEKEATSSVKAKYPDFKSVDYYKNDSWGEYLGNYLVIISSNVTVDNCTKLTYGIGYGADYSKALQNALKNIASRNWNWSENKHGYSIVEHYSLQ
jgi:hypothetical protein